MEATLLFVLPDQEQMVALHRRQPQAMAAQAVSPAAVLVVAAHPLQEAQQAQAEQEGRAS